MSMIYSGNNKGLSVVEIIVVIAIIVIILASLLNLALFSLRFSIAVKETKQANLLAVEMIEIARNFRDSTDWHNNGLGSLVSGIAYYPLKDTAVSPPAWTLAEGEEIVGQFTRKLIFSNANRDAEGNIIQSGGVEDSDTKQVRAIILWKDKEIEIITYLTNWR